MSRPPKPTTLVASFRLSSEEHAALKTSADARGMSLSDYLHQRLLRSKELSDIRRRPSSRKREILAPATAPPEVRALATALIKIGTNANQIARAVNRGALSGDFVEAGAVLSALNDVVSHLETIGRSYCR
jgi:hypothetical protein